MNIPLVDLHAQYLTIQEEITHALGSVLSRGDFIHGRDVDAFEKEFGAYTGAKHVIGVGNGTDALRLMIQTAGLSRGDEVIVQANTFIATVIPLVEIGAVPVLVDCDLLTGQIDIDDIATHIHKKTRAILPVHLFGHPAPIKNIQHLIHSQPITHNIQLLEDAAQAHGVRIGKKHVGTFGTMAAFSFYPGKNLGAYGDAGAVVTNDAKLAQALRIIGNVGQDRKYHHPKVGTNSRLDTMQAAVLRVKLKHLDTWNTKRNTIANRLIRDLSNVGDLILPPLPQKGTTANWHIFAVRTQKRDALQAYLLKHGIHTGIHYPIPLHLQPALRYLKYKKGDFPNTEKRASTMLSLPLYAELTEEQITYMIQTIQKFFK